MSDSNPGDSPYGPPPPAQNPYGQNPYGQAPYGGQAPAPYGGGPDADRRPGTVTAAAVITLVTSGLVLAMFAISGLVLAVAGDEVLDRIRVEPDFEEVNPDDLVAVGLVVILVVVVWCLAAMVLAVLAMRRSNGARITLVVSAAMTAAVSLVGIASVFPAVTLVAAVATIVCLFTGGAPDWFARRGRQQEIPGVQQF